MAERYAGTAFRNGYEFTRGSGYALPEYPFREPPEIAAGQPSHHPVVIVGGGITGLTAACALALLYAEVAGDLRAAGHLRAHRRQGHPVERGPHLRRPRRGVLV
jgi:hypothetical protein